MSLKIAQGFMNLTTKEIDCILHFLTIFTYVSRHTKRNPVKKCHHWLAEASAEQGVWGVSFDPTQGRTPRSPVERPCHLYSKEAAPDWPSLQPIWNQGTGRNNCLKQTFKKDIFSFKVEGKEKNWKRKEKSSSGSREGEMGSYLWATCQLGVSFLAGPRAL